MLLEVSALLLGEHREAKLLRLDGAERRERKGMMLPSIRKRGGVAVVM